MAVIGLHRIAEHSHEHTENDMNQIDRIALNGVLQVMEGENALARLAGEPLKYPPNMVTVIASVLNRAPEDEPATTAKPEPVRPQRWEKQRVSNPAVAEVCHQLAECTKTEYRQTLVNTIETITRHYRIKDWASMALFLSLHTDNRCSPTGDRFNQSNLMRILDECLDDGYITSQQLDSWVTRPRMTKKNRQRAGA